MFTKQRTEAEMREEIDLEAARLEVVRLAKEIKDAADRLLLVATQSETKTQMIVEDLDRHDEHTAAVRAAEQGGAGQEPGHN